MKTLSDIVNEGSDKLATEVNSAVAFLNDSLSALFPKEDWKFHVRYSTNIGKSLTILVYSTKKESVKVTYHNADTMAHFMMHLDSASNLAKPAFQKLNLSLPAGVKYRKISDKTIMGASKKMVAWFKKNHAAWMSVEG